MEKLEEYYRLRNYMRTGDIINWQGSGPISWLIAKLAKGRSHTSLIVEWRVKEVPLHSHPTGQNFEIVNLKDGRIDVKDVDGRMYSNKRLFCTEAWAGGIRVKSVSGLLQRYKGKAWWLRLKSQYNTYRIAIGFYALQDVDVVKYDYEALFEQIRSHVTADPKKQFCSEHAFIESKRAGIPRLQRMAIAPKPGDMFDLGIYEKPVRIL